MNDDENGRSDEALMEAARARIAALASGSGDGAPEVRLRRSRMMILVIEETGLVMLDYATRECIDCSDVALALLKAAEDWQGALALVDGVEGADRRGLAEEARSLVDGGFLVVEGTKQARLEERYEELWEWDVRAGLFHFSIKDPEWVTEAQRLADLGARVEERAVDPFYTTNEGFDTVIPLGRPSHEEGIFAVLSKRQTLRRFADRPIARDALRDCLYAGLGITGFADEPVPGMGRPPFKMTPSGGGRNPYEAYVYARAVDGLPTGVYHYSALESSLGLVAAPPLPPPRALLVDRGWTDGAAALVLLVANFRRTAWKYTHPNVYRVVLIEAGHIGQNIMIAATAHGLTAAPQAFYDTPVERLLGLDRVTQGAVYALLIGEPAPDARRGVVHVGDGTG